MKKIYASLTALCVSIALFAQQPEVGTPEYAQWLNSQAQQTQRNGGPAVQPLNGNDTLNMTYSNTACGLNYSLTSVRLGQRFQPVGAPQPAPMNVNAVPACATVLQAYLYTECLGVVPSITATLTDPASTTTNVPMLLIGSSVDVCWGMNGTHMWRADVTSLITSPGTYTISGMPTSLSTSSADVEGATLLIIYQDPTASYTGSIQIDDGCHTVPGGQLFHTMTGFNACSASSSGSSFMLVGDMQMMGYSIAMNGAGVVQPMWNWWNEIITPTNVTSGQNSCQYMLAHGGDCFTLGVAGLYFQTNCNGCTPSQIPLAVSVTGTATTCGNNGSATATATGGNGNYTYTWVPGNQTTATATGLAAGTYTVLVTDGATCGSATVSITNGSMVATVSATGATCFSPTGSATVAVTGGNAPYTYAWAPSGGTGATATGLAPGNYTCTITDAASCTTQVTVAIVNGSSLQATCSTVADSCPSPSGAAFCTPMGGNAPYTYLWSTGATTSAISPVAAGSYTVTVTDAAGCTTTTVAVVPTGPSGFQHGTNVSAYGVCGDSVMLYAYSTDPTSTFSWSPSGLVASPMNDSTWAYPVSSMMFYVTITGQCGTVTDSVWAVIDTNNYYNEQICFVTVDTATNHNLVIWERSNSPSSGFYNIYRETAVSGVYALLATQPVSQFSTYLDVTSNPIVQPYRYQITTVDACGVESDTSLHHRSIHLQVSASPFGGWNLSWTAYEGLPIMTYNIYRGPNISNLTLLTSVAGSVFTYTDLTAPVGPVWYLIEAVHPNGGCSPTRWSAPGNVTPYDYNSMLSNFEVGDPTSIVDQSLQNSLTVSPNPGNGNFVLSCNLGSADMTTVTITDALGQVVFVKTEAANGSSMRMEMDLSALAAGMYTVHVSNGKSEGVTKLVITQ